MSYTPQQYAHALYECMFDAKKSQINLYVKNLYTILVKNNDVGLFKQILNNVNEIDKQKKQIVDIVITSASTIGSDILKQTRQMFPYKKTSIKQVIDSSLIGGIKIQINDTVIDGSIKKQLNKLKQQMK